MSARCLRPRSRCSLPERSLADYFDEVALDALLMAQADVRRGALDASRQVKIRETLDELVEDLQDDEPAPPAEEDEAKAEAEKRPDMSVICIGGRTPLD